MRVVFITAALILASCQNEVLINSSQIVGDAIPAPLTSQAGNLENGKALFTAREQGHCVLCHQVIGLDAEFQGNIGPSLNGIADRLTAGQMRLRIADYDRVKPGTTMPPYYRLRGLNQVSKNHTGMPVLSAQDIEDIIAYLSTLTLETDDGL